MKNQQKYLHKLSIFGYILALLVFAVLYFSQIGRAQTVTRGYSSDNILQKGMIVKLKDDDPQKVEPVNIDKADKIHGVVIDPNDSAVLLSYDNQKVFVASSGPYTVLVSDQNGPIKLGDYIAVSSVSGIGMAAGDNDKVVIGKAIEAFNPEDQNQVRVLWAVGLPVRLSRLVELN